MIQTPAPYQQPSIHLDFAQCGDIISVPIKYFGIGSAENEEGVACDVAKTCVDGVSYVVNLGGLEYVSSTLSIGSYNANTETIEVGTQCSDEALEGTLNLRVTNECVFPTTVTITQMDEAQCLLFIASQLTKISAGISCKQIQECFDQGLDCTKSLTK